MASDDYPARHAQHAGRLRIVRPWRVLLPAAVVALVLAFFGEFLIGGRVYYPGDIARLYLPLRAELTHALHDGRLPWWTGRLGVGYPLLAEGEVGALYPPNWLTTLLFPAAVGISASIVGHYALAGAGLFAYLRALGRSRGAALLGALAGSVGGFYVAHLSHLSMLHTAAWLPWLLFFTQRVLAGEPKRARALALNAAGLTAAVAMQFLAGHAQMALLGLLALGPYGLLVVWPRLRSAAGRRALACWSGALLAGTLLASPQLVASLELGTLSQRAGGLEGEFFMSYSFHPLLIATFLSPYALGNPYPQGSVELMGYLGLLPLGLTAVALLRGRDRLTWFYVALGALGLLLALGRWNPVYAYLQRVPVLNLFRVPARYLYWVTLAVVVLAARGLDGLAVARSGWSPHGRWALVVGTAAAVGTALAALLLDTDELIAAWKYLPVALGGATLVVVLGARWLPRPALVALAVTVLCADLYAYGAVLDGTYNAAVDAAWVAAEPASAGFLRMDAGLYRTYTKEEILPALAVQRESLYPNMAATHGLSSANLYAPLVPRRYAEHLENLAPNDLDRMNVRYYLIPQLLPVDEASELYDVHNPFAALPVNTWVEIGPLPVAEVQVESFLTHSADLPDGTLVAELLWRDVGGRVHALPLRVGRETAEWAYERSDVRRQIAHSRPPVAHSYPARSGFPPEDHPGYVYEARYDLGGAPVMSALQVRVRLPEAFVRVERVALLGPDGRETTLSRLIGLGEHRIVYRSEDVLIYRNEDAWARAYALSGEQARLEGDRLTVGADVRAADLVPVQVARYEATTSALRVEMPNAGYVVLADLVYPGWYAYLDGSQAPVLTVDGLYRGVSLPAGTHEVTFVYRPPLVRWVTPGRAAFARSG